MSNQTVSIIIPNFNGEDLIAKNLPKVLEAKNFKENRIIEIIIIDDASFDNSVKIIKKDFPQVKLIKHSKNRGFSCSANMGVRMAKGSFIVLLNTDVIPERNFLVSALPHFNDKNVFAVSLKEKGYSWAKGSFVNGFVKHEPGKEVKNPHITLWASGGSSIFRRSIWMKLQGMDEKLLSPFYWEDIDLSYRAVKRGYKILWEPNSLVEHRHESTISKLSKSYVQRIRERNELLFIWKNITSKNLIKKHVTSLITRVIRKPGYIRIVFMALLKFKLVLKRRKQEIKESKVSDEAIFAKF
ncbi:MAG: glycosyltransferase [Patescibacteria group bacterium]